MLQCTLGLISTYIESNIISSQCLQAPTYLDTSDDHIQTLMYLPDNPCPSASTSVNSPNFLTIVSASVISLDVVYP
jgi:hypothetical protein